MPKVYINGKFVSTTEADITERGICQIPLNDKCMLWSPEEPNLYTLKTETDGMVKTQRVGIKIFKKDNLGFTLNGNPITLRMASICWHRWQRVTNLYKKYNELESSKGEIKYIDIVKAGKNLLRTPCTAIEFEDGKGRLLVSQMMFDGRLANKQKGFFDLKNDVAASQMLVNIIKYL